MNDDETPEVEEKPDRPDGEIYSEFGRIGTKAHPLGISKTGKALTGAAGRPMTPELKRKMAEGRQRKKEERDRQREIDRLAGRKPGKPGKRSSEGEDFFPHRAKALKTLTGLLDEEKATTKQRYDAAVKILEYTDGKPTQRIEQEFVQKIEYILSAHEPAPLQLVPPSDDPEPESEAEAAG